MRLVAEDLSIPEMPKSEVERWARIIRPVVMRQKHTSHKGKDGSVVSLSIKNVGLWTIKPCDLFEVAFPWSPKFDKPFSEVPGNIQVWSKIYTLHTYGYHGMFKPSVAEVIRQIPRKDLEKAEDYGIGWFLVEGPEDAADLNMHMDIINAGFHLAKTTLFYDKDVFEKWMARDAEELRASRA